MDRPTTFRKQFESRYMFTWTSVWLVGTALLITAVHSDSMSNSDEEVIRAMANQAVDRLNKKDPTVFTDFWVEDADYVGVNGTLTKGRANIQALFDVARSSVGQQKASIDQIRFITPELATVDGSWTVTGARDTHGKELPPLQGRGFELVQKKHGRWRFIETREMVIFRGA